MFGSVLFPVRLLYLALCSILWRLILDISDSHIPRDLIDMRDVWGRGSVLSLKTSLGSRQGLIS